MKKIVPFIKNIDFETNIDEITSISLDRKVNKIENGEIAGDFDLYLEYKESDVSVNMIKYNDKIPFNIEIDDRYSLNNVKVDIDDFYYELDDNSVILHIDLVVDNLEYNNREIDELLNENNNEIEKIVEEDNSEPIDEMRDNDLFKEVDEEKVEVNMPIYQSFDPEKEDYVTYNVHIVREDDNIETICVKYGVTKEDLAYYNDISTIKLGDKLIVPTTR